MPHVLLRFPNQKINSYLKEIGAIVGTNNPLIHHLKRKTFASSVVLYNDAPMGLLSNSLGYSSMQITREIMERLLRRELVTR
ncbi:hypothetical protein QSE00_07870 [Arenibacter sp. M-2]|uniref:hypothetical protein n=1 Tax=Arenibacter sp. M-2 TaxID=3053612 RepID=UPI0025709D60|nr:hypothetical protein [Arenibacter sp. M-2]MDL5511723.1 hypothetical protein [Arenibacter sp. M-2]